MCDLGKMGWAAVYWILQDTAYIYQHTAHIIFNKLKRRNASSNFSSCYNPFFSVEIWDFHVVFTTHQIFTFPSALSLVSAALTNHCNIRHVSFVHHPWYLDPSYFIPNCTPAFCFNWAITGKNAVSKRDITMGFFCFSFNLLFIICTKKCIKF